MGISSAVQWWEEWQLRVLVLSSLVIQWLLFISAIRRKYVISYWSMRSLIWLAYLGSDAIAIYALAALFNRQRKQNYAATNNKSILELLWAPILLMHLGGQDCITAYNIEDNELWRRHVLTAVSQFTVAIYVFCKSWPSSGHKRLLQVSILAFVPGILKCLEKPWALKKASINSLFSSSDPVPRTAVSRMGGIDPLQQYVKIAKDIVDAYGGGLSEAQAVEDGGGDPFSTRRPLGIRRPSHLFADLASPYSDRIVTLRSFWMLDKRQAFTSLQIGIHDTFDLLYTKIKMTTNLFKLRKTQEERGFNLLQLLFNEIRFLVYVLPLITASLLTSSFLKAYDKNDAKVTLALFWCTGVLEYVSYGPKMYNGFKKMCGSRRLPGMKISPVMVAQYSLVGFFARNQRHNTMMCIMSSFGCKDLIDQLWSMKPCRSSAQIIELVVEYVKKGWKEEIHDAASYRKFNDRRGQWTLGVNHLHHLSWSIRSPFDESVLLWHIATDVCFFTSSPHQDVTSAPHHDRVAWCETSPHYEIAVRCREISKYMMYLLFVNPEMLLAGTRRNLFTTANAQLEEILKGQILSSNDEVNIIGRLKSWKNSLSQEQPEGSRSEEQPEGSHSQEQPKCFFHGAMELADALCSIDDEENMWKVIQGVWVEMLCYSASRSRGYLHAKSLGAGGEFLTYVWLLLSHMGMMTLPERLQGAEMEIPNTSDDPIQVAALGSNLEVVEHLLPLTSPIPGVSNRTVDGIVEHALSKIAEEMAKLKEGTFDKVSTLQRAQLTEVSSEAKKRSLEAKSRGDDDFRRKDYLAAVDAYTQAIELDPNDAALLSDRSLCWLLAGQAERALEDARACRALRPDWAQACFREGAALRLLQRFHEAAKAFAEGVQLEPDNKELVSALREAVHDGIKFHGTDKQNPTVSE